MNAIERLAKRLLGQAALLEDEADAVASFIYEDFLPSQIIGMKEAAERLGLATSNTLCMRLSRGDGPQIVAHVAKNRITTVDACDAYLEQHGKSAAISDDVRREAS